MEQELHEEKIGSGRKVKRLNNKRERNQMKQILKNANSRNFDDDFCIEIEDLMQLERSVQSPCKYSYFVSGI